MPASCFAPARVEAAPVLEDDEEEVLPPLGPASEASAEECSTRAASACEVATARCALATSRVKPSTPGAGPW